LPPAAKHKFPLAEAAKAQQKLEPEHVRGKVAQHLLG